MLAILMCQLVDMSESDLNLSLKDENLSKSNALFLDNELQSSFEIAERLRRTRIL